MKKILISLVLISCVAFNAGAPPKTFTIVLNENQLQDLWGVIDQSNASNLKVKLVQAIIQEQISQQLQAAAAKDSMDKKKAPVKKP